MTSVFYPCFIPVLSVFYPSFIYFDLPLIINLNYILPVMFY